MAAKAASRTGQEIVFGIRPENIADARLAPGPDPDRTVKAKVDVVEPMGAEIYIYFNTGAHAFIARMTASEQARVGEEIPLVFSLKKAHLFDPESGVALV